MRSGNMENRIRTAVEHTTPDVLDRILSSCDEQKGTVIHMTETAVVKKRRVRWAPVTVLAAMLVLCAGLFGFRNWQAAHSVDSVIMLDVNPSLSITVNAREKVLDVQALNEDARTVIGDMELRGTSLDVAVNALIGSMLQNGYLNELQNAILVSVENNDAAKSAALQTRISSAIDSLFQGSNLDAAVLSQTVTEDEALLALAKQYNISVGKAALIEEVISGDVTLRFEALVPLSVNEIALLSASRDIQSDSVVQTGAASDKAYIGEQAALEAAYKHAGLSASAVTHVKVEFDSDDGIMVYEVDFTAGSVEYEYDIHARTGEVIKYESEAKTFGQQTDSGKDYIGEEAAKAAALQDAGLGSTQVNMTKCELDYDDGAAYYDVEFRTDDSKYEYEIHAQTGTVIRAERDKLGGQGGAVPSDNTYIGEEAAKSAALAHAGYGTGDTTYLHAYLDYDDGIPEHYEVEFMVGNTRYQYEISLYTGAVLSRELETCMDSGSVQQGGWIDEASARAAALSHAGLSAAEVTKLESELDYDDGRAVYEVEFRYNGYEYDYEIDAATGTVLKAEIDD